jgi:hypothetical protein
MNTRSFVTTALSILAAVAGLSTVCAPAAVPARPRYLLLDSRIVDRVENARLAVGQVTKHPRNPLFGEDRPWEARFDNLYANVIYDEQAGRYRCWYSPFIVDAAASATPRAERATTPYRPGRREMGVCYAESRDGLTWTKPALGLVEFQGSKANNLVLRGPHGVGILCDHHATDPQRRYKMLYAGLGVRFSPDGLRWSTEVRCPLDALADTHNNAFWAPECGCYVGITRTWADGQRLVARIESPDFTHWTPAVEVLRGAPQSQIYALPVFRVADVYLGLAMVLHRLGDRVDCELAWSPDTVHWQRIEPGTPLIPNAAMRGAYDSGCVYAALSPVFRPGEVRLYYGGSNGPHGGWRDGFFCLATLRPDGFAGYRPVDPARPAVVITRPVVCLAQPLRITADAAGGSVRVSLVDASGKPLAVGQPIGADVTDGPVTLPAGTLAALVGQPIALRIEFTRARVYAFSWGK